VVRYASSPYPSTKAIDASGKEIEEAK